VTSRIVLVAFGLWLANDVAGAGQPVASVSPAERPIIGVYFVEPFKLLEPFEKDFRRSCSCVDSAFALVPRIVDSPAPIGGSLVPLRPSAPALRAVRDMADAESSVDPLSPRTLITGRGLPFLDGPDAIALGVQRYVELANRGQADAQAELGYLFATGLGVPQDDHSAAFWYGQAALQGWPDAKLALAAMYALGRGVPRDDRAAAYWLLQSQQSHLQADAYACGMGVEQDFARARELYEVAANRESADAQYQLATMYLNGCGVGLDDELAEKWFQKAADLGHPEAQIALSEVLERGLNRGGRRSWQAYLLAEFALARLPEQDPSRVRALSARERALASLSAEDQAFARRVLQTMLDEARTADAAGIKSLRSTFDDSRAPSPQP
jgi:TPR repeat protein